MQAEMSQDVPRIKGLDVMYVLGALGAISALIVGGIAWQAGRSEGQMLFLAGLVAPLFLLGYYFFAKWVGFPAIRR